MEKNWWIAELTRYGYVGELVDGPQVRLLEAIDRGEEVIAHERPGHRSPKNWTFSTDADGFSVLYLSMSAWALIKKARWLAGQRSGGEFRLFHIGPQRTRLRP